MHYGQTFRLDARGVPIFGWDLSETVAMHISQCYRLIQPGDNPSVNGYISADGEPNLEHEEDVQLGCLSRETQLSTIMQHHGHTSRVSTRMSQISTLRLGHFCFLDEM
jgi:hypothetical protein